jgi:protoheme IX farnesyltransferase
VLTGAAAAVYEGSLVAEPLRLAALLFFLGMAGGAANAFNQYFEREVDARMRRTRKRRPLPMGRLHPGEALAWAVALSAISVGAFWLLFTPLSAALALATILFYALFYTLVLKPRTPQNIVIGGIAGSMGPVIAWAAATGTVAWEAWAMFGVIFFWTPPHFWALAVYMKEDYVEVGYPMLPNVAGVARTWQQSLFYAGVTIAVSFLLLFSHASWLYGIGAGVLGGWFLLRVLQAKRDGGPVTARRAFTTSIVYLLALFIVIILDRSLLG